MNEVGLGPEIGLELEEEVMDDAGHVVLVLVGEDAPSPVPAMCGAMPGNRWS